MKRLTNSFLSAVMILGALALLASPAQAIEYNIEGGGGGGGGGSGTTTPTYTNKIVYLQGRSMYTWPSTGKLVAPSNWNHVITPYNGNVRINDSTVRAAVKNALKVNCRAPNQCVILCYSAGCFRMLKGLDELKSAGTPADKILWIEATASAAGGTKLADTFTKGLAKLIAKILGKYEAVDNDLRVSAARSSYGYIQNRAPVAMYHLAGTGNICKKILLFIKLCSNKYLQGGRGDGAVSMDSACGFSAAGTKSSCLSSGTKYTNRYVSGNSAYSHNHVGMAGQGVKNASVRLGYTSSYNTATGVWADPGTAYRESDCLYDDCDGQETYVSSSTCAYYRSPSLAAKLNAGDTTLANTSITCGGGTCINLSGLAPAACDAYTGGGGYGCFVADTQISMADGSSRSIQDVKIGDIVKSYNVDTGEVVHAPVTRTFVHENIEGLAIVNGIKATPNHPFYANGSWVRADQLSAGDEIIMLGEHGAISSMAAMSASAESLVYEGGLNTVYNIEVDNHHNYFAGGVLVHNK